VTPQMTSNAASNGPQPFFPYPLTEDQLLGQHFFGILQFRPEAIHSSLQILDGVVTSTAASFMPGVQLMSRHTLRSS
jgi:hypothetical protein